MSTTDHSGHDFTRRAIRFYFWLLLGTGLALGVLHLYFSDLQAGKVYWFNLDKERNLPTWFSGVLFFLFGCSALVAFSFEKKRNSEGPPCFRLPFLWLGIALAGLFLSLDEITILHENLFWHEIRVATSHFGDTWRYLTQWQILFAPAILLGLGFFVLFFSNRFRTSPGARRSAFAGIGCWTASLFLEGIREAFKQAGASEYNWQVFLEEEFEIAGGLFFLAAVVFYTIDIALDLTPERRERLTLASRFLTRHGLVALTATLLILLASGGTAFLSARRQASREAPVPSLYRKATESRPTAGHGAAGLPTEDFFPSWPEVWFDKVIHPIFLRGAEEQAITRFITASLFSPQTQDVRIPEELGRDPFPRIVFLSISDGRTPARVVLGGGMGIREAMERALTRAKALQRAGLGTQWVRLDIVEEVEPLNHLDPSEPMEFERGIHGIAFDRSAGIAFLPGEVLARTLVTSERKIRKKNISRYLRKRSPALASRLEARIQSGDLTGYRFTTRSLFLDPKEAASLYREHRVFQKLDPEELLSAARRGGDYLVHAVAPSGKFLYSYLPKTDEIPGKYNMLRHAGTIYAMLELHEVTGEPGLLRAARRAIGHLLHAVKPCHVGEETLACLVDRGHIKLGGNALAAIALAKYTEVTWDHQYRRFLIPLGRWIQTVQNEKGEFFIQKQSHPDGAVIDFVSTYYPGEALLALVRIYSLEPDESLLDTAEKGARFLITERDRDRSLQELDHDHWFLYALHELYRHRPRELYLNHARRIALAIVESQNREPEFPDWMGSYYRPPRSTSTAIRTEGLYAAYRLARATGRSEDAKRFLEAIRLGVRFQLQTQFGPESVMYLPDPRRSLGGFHRSLTDFEIRIDYVQHNISALLGLYRILAETG